MMYILAFQSTEILYAIRYKTRWQTATYTEIDSETFVYMWFNLDHCITIIYISYIYIFNIYVKMLHIWWLVASETSTRSSNPFNTNTSQVGWNMMSFSKSWRLEDEMRSVDNRCCWYEKCSKIDSMVTPLKINMEPENAGLEDEFPFQTADFQVPC